MSFTSYLWGSSCKLFLNNLVFLILELQEQNSFCTLKASQCKNGFSGDYIGVKLIDLCHESQRIFLTQLGAQRYSRTSFLRLMHGLLKNVRDAKSFSIYSVLKNLGFLKSANSLSIVVECWSRVNFLCPSDISRVSMGRACIERQANMYLLSLFFKSRLS